MSELNFPFAKFHVRAADHPKIASLSDRDYRAWTEMFLYCADNLTDGFLPSKVAQSRWRKSLKGLVAGGLLHEAPDGFDVHDYLHWNDSKAEVEARKEHARRAALSKASGYAPSTPPSGAQTPARDEPTKTNTNTTREPEPKPEPGKTSIFAPEGADGEKIKGFIAGLEPSEEPTRWIKAPPGISDTQASFVRKLGGGEAWWPAIHKAKGRYPSAVVTTALGHLAENGQPIDNPYARLEAECQLVQVQESA